MRLGLLFGHIGIHMPHIQSTRRRIRESHYTDSKNERSGHRWPNFHRVTHAPPPQPDHSDFPQGFSGNSLRRSGRCTIPKHFRAYRKNPRDWASSDQQDGWFCWRLPWTMHIGLTCQLRCQRSISYVFPPGRHIPMQLQSADDRHQSNTCILEFPDRSTGSNLL